MQQLEIVYLGIKGAILVKKMPGLPIGELTLFNPRKYCPPPQATTHIPSPPLYSVYIAIVLTGMSIKLHPQSAQPWYLL